jgi:hypothetical protein
MKFIVVAFLVFIFFVIFIFIQTNILNNSIKFDYDCDDFQTQAQAQKVFEVNPKDIYDLDRNKDGIACSSLK